MLTDEGHFPSGIHNTVNDTFVIRQTFVHIIISPFSTLLVKPGAKCLCKAMQIDTPSLGIYQKGAVHVQGR